MNNGDILENLVREGAVSSVDKVSQKVRVVFRDTKIISGWLSVLQHPCTDISVTEDGEHTHAITDTFSGGGSADTIPSHNHPNSYTTYWMPKINSRVLVLYLPVFNGDGFVLGGI